MMVCFEIAHQCAKNGLVVFADLDSRRAAEVDMGAGQPVAEPEIAHVAWPDLQDVGDNLKCLAFHDIELEAWQHELTPRCHYDDLVATGHRSHDPCRVARLDTQQLASPRRVDEIQTCQEACRDFLGFLLLCGGRGGFSDEL